MLNEARRRAYLSAMQMVHWLPRAELPFAAPSRAALLQPIAPWDAEPAPLPAQDGGTEPFPVQPATARAALERGTQALRQVLEAGSKASPPASKPLPSARPGPSTVRANLDALRPASHDTPSPSPAATAAPGTLVVTPVSDAAEHTTPATPVRVPPPRFSLQLLRAGQCLLLVELATGQPLQSRDPSYLLLKDMLRAAGLPDAPQVVGEPVRWPLFQRSQMDQGPAAAREFVRGFVQARVEEAPSACLWLVGLPAVRFAAEDDSGAEAYYQVRQVPGLGDTWSLPGLELLMDEPQRKADVWKAMRQLMARWKLPE